jgi:hypothetical protein
LARYGDIGYDVLHRLDHLKMVSRMPVIDDIHSSDTCILTKQSRTPFPTKAKFIATTPLELVHNDLCGPITSTTPGGQ